MITAVLAAAALCARFALGIVFVAAGVAKLRHPAAFARALDALGAGPAGLRRQLAIALPVFEVCCGAALASGLFIELSALVVAALTTSFTAVLVSLLASGRAVPCDCFGPGGGPASWHSVLRNAALAGCAGLVARWGTPVLALDGLWASSTGALAGSDALALLIATSSVMLAGLLVRRLSHPPRIQVAAR